VVLSFVEQAAHMLAERWGTELLVPIEKCTTMACVRCPLEAYDAAGVDLFKLIWDRFGSYMHTYFHTYFQQKHEAFDFSFVSPSRPCLGNRSSFHEKVF
jgi:hypothetical protein